MDSAVFKVDHRHRETIALNIWAWFAIYPYIHISSLYSHMVVSINGGYPTSSMLTHYKATIWGIPHLWTPLYIYIYIYVQYWEIYEETHLKKEHKKGHIFSSGSPEIPYRLPIFWREGRTFHWPNPRKTAAPPGRCSPTRTLMAVDFPAPLAPITATRLT